MAHEPAKVRFAVYGADDEVDRTRLVPGASVRRYTDAGPDGSLDTAAPCCGRIARLHGNWRRAEHFVLCGPCALAYDVDLIDENDGGFAAVFVVRDEQPTLTRHHAVEVTTSPGNVRKGDVIVAVALSGNLAPDIQRNHPLCGETVQATQYLGVVRKAQLEIGTALVKLTFTSGESVRVEAHTYGWVVRRRGTSQP